MIGTHLKSFATFCLLFIGISLCFSQKESISKENFHLYLLAGQSNMAGRGIVEPQDTAGNPRILVLNRNGEWEIAREPIHFDKPGAGVGPGLAFAREMLKSADEKVVIGLIPAAAGGSSIHHWLNNEYWEQTKSFPYNDAIARTKLALQTGTLQGILWHQGEADCKNPELYREKIVLLVEKFRKEFQSPELPFVAGELPEFNACAAGFNRVLNETKKLIPYFDVVSGEGLTPNSDNLHIDAASQRIFGKRYAEKVQNTGNNELNILNFKAVGDGKTVNTKAIQKAIDECSKRGGGKVIVPAGIFISGTLYLRDNVTIYLAENAVLKGSSSFSDYPDNPVKYHNSFSYPGRPFGNKALIFAEGTRNIALTGHGTIDGSGDNPAFQLGNDNNPESRRRPSVISLIKCNRVTVESLHLQNSAYWMQNYVGCDTLVLRGLNIYNHSNFNQDAMDIDASNVLVENCVIDADDDGICLKSHNFDRLVENVVVRNCTIASNCNAIKFGTKSEGGFRNVKISNCLIHKASADHIRHWQETLQFIEQPTTVISGLAFESVDGGIIENIEVSDIVMRDVQTPIFVILGRRNVGQAGDFAFYKADKPVDKSLKAGYARNISLKNIDAVSHSKMSSSITASAGNVIENVRLENIKISSMGHGTADDAAIVLKEYAGFYPENRMYGQIYPSSGFYFRRVKNVELKNVELTLRNEDYRPSIIFDNTQNAVVKNLKAD